VALRRSKTDPLGAGREVLPQLRTTAFCPIRAWITAVRRAALPHVLAAARMASRERQARRAAHRKLAGCDWASLDGDSLELRPTCHPLLNDPALSRIMGEVA